MKPADAHKLVRRYQAGVSIQQLTKEFSVGDKPIRRVLSQAGVAIRGRLDALRATICKARPTDYAARYLAGESCADIGRSCGVKGDTVKRWLEEDGVTIRPAAEAVRLAKAKPCPPDLIARYLAGESPKALADAYGISRGGIDRSGPNTGRAFGLVRMLIEAGVPIRGRPEAEALKWSRAGEEQRAKQVLHAHRKNCSPDEISLILALGRRGVAAHHRREVGPYNVDLAVHGLPVAVELQRVWPIPPKSAPAYRQRLENILNRGWLVLYVGEKLTDADAVADEVIALAKLARRKKSVRGGHRVIYGNGKPCPAPCPQFHGLPVV